MILKASTYEQRKGMKNGKVFRLPFVDDGTDAVDDKVRTYLLCKRGLVILLSFGERRYVSIRSAAMSSAQVRPDSLLSRSLVMDSPVPSLPAQIILIESLLPQPISEFEA